MEKPCCHLTCQMEQTEPDGETLLSPHMIDGADRARWRNLAVTSHARWSRPSQMEKPCCHLTCQKQQTEPDGETLLSPHMPDGADQARWRNLAVISHARWSRPSQMEKPCCHLTCQKQQTKLDGETLLSPHMPDGADQARWRNLAVTSHVRWSRPSQMEKPCCHLTCQMEQTESDGETLLSPHMPDGADRARWRNLAVTSHARWSRPSQMEKPCCHLTCQMEQAELDGETLLSPHMPDGADRVR